MHRCHRVFLQITSLVSLLILAACGGGGGATGTGTGTGGGSTGLGAYVQPPRYAASSYSQFISTKGTTDLTGTWIMLISGVRTNGMTAIVTGRNYTETDQYFARAIVRINTNPNVTNGYYVYSCGPGGAANTSTTFAPGATSLYLPYFSYSSSDYGSYLLTVVDADTLQNTNVVRDWGWYGSQGWAMSYTLSFTYKRISDDPFATIGSVTDLNTSLTTETGCIYESEGDYTVTENDSYQQNLNKSGTFYNLDVYPVSAVNGAPGSYSLIFNLVNLSGYYAIYTRSLPGGSAFYSENGDTITPTVSVNGNESTYTVHAVSAISPTTVDDASLDFAP